MEQQVKEFESLAELLEECQKRDMKPAEMAATMERYIERKARNKGVPLRATLELTPLCNLDCKMCYVHLSKQQMENQAVGMLTGKQWIHILQQAIDMGLLEVTLTGGEALLHPDFDEILDFLTEKNIRVRLKSNGILLTPARVALLKERRVAGIQISLYGSNDDGYEQVTGMRVFRRVVDAIECVRVAAIPLEVVITPSIYMWEDMEALLRLVDSMDVKYTVNPGLIDPFEETGRAGQQHDLTLEQYIELSKMRARLNGVELKPSCMEEIPQFGGEHDSEVLGVRCAAGRSMFSVTWDGRVLPCRAMERIVFHGLETPFQEGWKMINHAVKHYLYPRECVGCEFEGICPSCAVQHERGAEPGHANKAFCLRAKRLAEEGFIRKRKS